MDVEGMTLDTALLVFVLLGVTAARSISQGDGVMGEYRVEAGKGGSSRVRRQVAEHQMTDAEIRQVVGLHNDFRSRTRASNMRQMVRYFI